LAVIPLLAACAGNDPVRAPRTELPGQFEAAAEAGVAPLDRWWVAYNDPQLTALIEEALASSPDALTAQSRLEEARAQRLASLRSAWPQGNLVGNGRVQGTDQIAGTQSPFSSSGTSQFYSLDFDVSWELDVFGRTRTARRAVENDFAARIFNIEGTRAALAANVADSLFAARGLAQQLADSQETLRIVGEQQRIANLRAERGLGSQADAARTAAEFSQAQATALQLEAELNAARRTLLVLLGRGAESRAALPVAAELGAPPSPPATVPGELLQRRPDVREAEQRLSLALAQLRIDRLDLFPKFTILPGVGLTRSEQTFGGQTFSSTMLNWSAGLGVSVPVLNRPQLIAEARVSGERAEQAVIAYERAVQTAYGEADNALLQLTADRNRLSLLEAGEQQARSAYESNRRLYDAGLSDLTTLLQTEQQWRAARSQATAARAQVLRRSVQAFKALGGGWDAASPPTANPST
jgi:NodT family efflux transporter outer membrane factor (OMF) lipoprotein